MMIISVPEGPRHKRIDYLVRNWLNMTERAATEVVDRMLLVSQVRRFVCDLWT